MTSSKNPKLTVFKNQGPFIRYLAFETSESVFKEKKLRQAIAALVNRPDFTQKVYLGQAIPLYSMVPNGMDYQKNTFKTVYGDGNVAVAEKLLKSLGYTKTSPSSSISGTARATTATPRPTWPKW